MRRSSGDTPNQQRPTDFDFGFGCQRPDGPTSPQPCHRHHTVSGGTASSRRSLQTALQEKDVFVSLKNFGNRELSLPSTNPQIESPILNPQLTTFNPQNVGFQTRRQTATGNFSIRKQDSIAEEPSPVVCEFDQHFEQQLDRPFDRGFEWSRSRSPSPVRAHIVSLDSPELRKRSLSPATTSNSLYTNVFSRRKNFQREVSAAHSDVTETVSRKQYHDAATSPIPPALSCENNLQIRFDISSGSSLAKSTSSSICRNLSVKKKKTSLAYTHGGSLAANGFVPLVINAEPRKSGSSYLMPREDPGKWQLSITKQRSCSESAFQPTFLEAIPNGLQVRRCSASVLNPAKEEALLRRILGPSGLSWIPDSGEIKNKKRDQQSKKSLSLVLSEDIENGGKKDQDDPKTPLMKEEKGGRLIQRQHLFIARRVTSDYALFFALLGIVIMIIENELSANHIYSKNSLTSIVLRVIIMLTTAALLAAVIKFHVHEVQLFMNANSAEDWRIALTFRRILQVVLELVLCSICPLPFDLFFSWTTVHADGVTVTTTNVPLDVILSIPMFFRLYWFCRVMLLHSRLFTDASSRSIAGLNRVTFNARFILKTLMTLCPGTMLMVFTASLWVMAAWILRLCERHHVGEPVNHHALKHQNYLNSLWMIAITFLSVGYGDIVPITYCGRGVAVVTGILGTCTSSMVVAVIARKLELTRAEKHVHNFMMDTTLTKQLKHSAANVLRETWLIYKYRRLVNKIDPGKIRHHQRKFLMAIYALRKVKRDQRKLAENSVSLGDVAKTTSNSYEMIHDIHSTQEGLALRMTAVEHQLSDIQREIGNLADVIRTAITPRDAPKEGYKRRESGYDPETSPNQRDSVRRRKNFGDL